MSSWGWLLDPGRCIGCKACEAACKQWNNVETGMDLRYRRVRTFTAGAFPALRIQILTGSCNHCENPLCARACPVKATSVRADGIVLVDKDRCTGCGLCQKFCPYGARQVNQRDRKIEKCAMCADRVDRGLEPACTTVCPTGALRWGPWSEISSQGVPNAPFFPQPQTTRPRVRFVKTGGAQ